MSDVQVDVSDASNTSKTDKTPASSSIQTPDVVQEPPPRDAQNTADEPLPTQDTQPLSKRAQKRLAKAAYYQEKKLERRQREKAVKKEKKRERRERIAAGEDIRDDGEPARKKAKSSGAVRPFNARVVVDLGFDSYMTDREIISLSSQLAFCYSANRRATCPFETILFTLLGGRLHARLERENNAGYKRWTSCEWWEEGYERLWANEPPSEEQTAAVEDSTPSGDNGTRSRSMKDTVIYLTADADEELEELKEGETYILGGIVDRNRHKFICQKKAVASGIRTAQLPIGKYLKEMKTRKVLTVNQVFEILVHWTENRNWEEAIHSVMPKRKFVQQPGKHPAQGGSVVQLDEVESASGDKDDVSSEEESENGIAENEVEKSL